jgi:hypothetical protein
MRPTTPEQARSVLPNLLWRLVPMASTQDETSGTRAGKNARRAASKILRQFSAHKYNRKAVENIFFYCFCGQ